MTTPEWPPPAAEFLTETFEEAKRVHWDVFLAACNLYSALACALAEDDAAARVFLDRMGAYDASIARTALLRLARLAAEVTK